MAKKIEDATEWWTFSFYLLGVWSVGASVTRKCLSEEESEILLLTFRSEIPWLIRWAFVVRSIPFREMLEQLELHKYAVERSKPDIRQIMKSMIS